MRRLLPLAALLVVAIVGVVWIAGRGESGPTPLLLALRNDPIARYVPPGARLTATREQDQGSTFGKAALLRYSRDFSVPGEEADAALAAALRTAREVGWRFSSPPSRTPGEFYGRQGERTVLGGRSARLTIILLTPPAASPSTPRTLQINLSATSGQVATE